MEFHHEIFVVTFILLTAWPSDGRPVCLLDLTHEMNNDTLHYPTHVPFQILNRRTTPLGTIKFATAEYLGSEHSGTHMDAPYNFNEKGLTMEKISIQNLEGPVVVINITARAKLNPDAEVTVKDLKDWEKKYGTIPENSWIIMNSGYSEYFWTNGTKYFGAPIGQLTDMHYPGFGLDACKWLLKARSIVGIAVDTVSGDPASDMSFRCHVVLSEANKLIIENMANVGQLPPNGAYMRAYPIKITGGSGAPARIIATLPSTTPCKSGSGSY